MSLIEQIRKLAVKSIKSHHKTWQNGMQKMPFYLAIHGLLRIYKKRLRIIMSLVELSAKGLASEITLILTENTYFLIK